MIRGIDEKDGEACGELVKQFMRNQLKIDATFINSVSLVRCHRLGNKPQGT